MAFLKEKIELTVAEYQLRIREVMGNFSKWQRIVLVCCLIGIIPSYSIVKQISYRLSTANLKNDLVQASPSFYTATPLVINPVEISKFGDIFYSAAVQIKNPNTELSLPETAVKIEFLNSKGQIVASSDTVLFLLPGQSKQLVVPKITSKDQIASGRVQLPEHPSWQKRLSIPTVKLSPSTPIFYNQNDPIAFAVEGTVYNQSPYLLKKITINYILYDKNNAVLGASSRSEFDMKPFERRAYKQLWPGIYTQNVIKVDVLPETNVLNVSNLVFTESDVSPASNLGR